MANKRTMEELAVDTALMEARGHMFHSLAEMPQMSGQIVVTVEATVHVGQINAVSVTRAMMGKKLQMPMRHD